MNGRAFKDRVLRILSYATGIFGVRHAIRYCVRRNLVPKSVWSRLPVAGTFTVDVAALRRFKYSSTAHDFVGRSLFWKGIEGYEPETTAAFTRLAESARVVIDIGANTGLYSLLACAISSDVRVLAFEPVPRIMDRLRRQVDVNGWANRCELVSAAVSDRDGTVDFHVPLGGLPHSASLNPTGFGDAPGQLVKVAVVALDTFCDDSLSVDLIKIDVEGFEADALRGMADLLADHHPALIFEVLDDTRNEQIESMLYDLGYQLFHLGEYGARGVQRIVADQRFRNFAAVARSNQRERLGLG